MQAKEQEKMQAYGQRFSFPEVDFCMDFPGASLGGIQRLGENYYYLDLRQDTWFWFHIRLERCKGREIIFQLRDRTPDKEKVCNYWTIHFHEDGRAVCHRPFVSYDGLHYERVEHAEQDYHEPDVIRFRHRFQEDTATLCYGVPYFPWQLEKVLDAHADSKFLRRDVIGHSRLGNPIQRLTISDFTSAERKPAWLLCREDQGETTAAYALEAIIEKLLADPPLSFLKKVELNVVPFVSIDGILNGSPFSNGYGYLSDRWGDDTELVELQAIQAAIKKSAPDGKLLFAGKMHGSVSWDNTNYVTMDPKDDYPSFFFAGNEKTARILCQKMGSGALEETLRRVGSRPGGRFESFVEQHFNCDFIYATELHCERVAQARQLGLDYFSSLVEHFS